MPMTTQPPLMTRKKRLTPTTPNSRQSQITSYAERQINTPLPFYNSLPGRPKAEEGVQLSPVHMLLLLLLPALLILLMAEKQHLNHIIGIPSHQIRRGLRTPHPALPQL
jgi:hypothetical protein